jgi:tetratricopeptide (TPR) repeat protein
MNGIKIKHKKGINEALILRAICCFLISVFALFTICIFVFAFARVSLFKLFYIFPLCAVPLSILYAYIVEKLGSNLGGRLSFWTSKKISLREQLSSDLARAKFSKGEGRFKEALSIINEVLDKDPDFPDALYLKGQILWEGFENSVESKRLFRRVLQLLSAEEALFRWSSTYIDEITAYDKMRVNEFNSDKK